MMRTTLAQLLRTATDTLHAVGIESAVLDARVLLEHATGLDRLTLITAPHTAVTDAQAEAYRALVARRSMREPVAYITGVREFWGMTLAVNRATLIPRPDTETLVETALRWRKKHRVPESGVDGAAGSGLRLLDCGTGSGCILLALLAEWPDAVGMGLDIQSAAIETAQRNAERAGVGNRSHWRVADWRDTAAWQRALASAPAAHTHTGAQPPSVAYDVVVANPPYIPTADLPGLMADVQYEPQVALDGGPDGLDAYRTLLPRIAAVLRPGGLALAEVGAGQADAVMQLMRAVGLDHVSTGMDLAGITRCVSGLLPE